MNLAMPGYIKCALKQFWHPHPKHPKHVPHAWQKTTYGITTQFTQDPNHTTVLDAADPQCIQEVVGVLLYYSQTPRLLTPHC